jgi:hypothetical protein
MSWMRINTWRGKFGSPAQDWKKLVQFHGIACWKEGFDQISALKHNPHPAFAGSKRWRMTTSTVPKFAPGFGNVEADGVGIGYDVLNDQCIFNVAAEKENGYAKRMKEEIGRALTDMRVFLNPKGPE